VATGTPVDLYSPYLKTYSYAACNMTVTHSKCAVDCTRLGRNQGCRVGCFGWSWSQILNNTGSRSWTFLSDSRCPNL